MMNWSNNPSDIAKYYNIYEELMAFGKVKFLNLYSMLNMKNL